MEDIFAVQDEIAQTIVDALRGHVGASATPAEPVAHLVRRSTHNVEAYNLYLQGKHCWSKRLVGLMWKGVECFRQAIEVDPAGREL
jgi:hypothetical protein